MSRAADRIDQLDDYVSGHMNDADAATFEADVFEAAARGAAGDAAFLDAATRMLTVFGRHGGFATGGTRADVDALVAAGMKIHFVELDVSGSATAPFPLWGAGVEVVVARLGGVDLRPYGLMDIEVETADGSPVKTFRDVTCDPTDGALYAICQEPLARLAFARGRTISRVIAKQGARREIVATLDVSPLG
jgi:hypothetical protein